MRGSPGGGFREQGMVQKILKTGFAILLVAGTVFHSSREGEFIAYADQLTRADGGYMALRKATDGLNCKPDLPKAQKDACDQCKAALDKEKQRMERAYRQATDDDAVQQAWGANCPVLTTANQNRAQGDNTFNNDCGSKTQKARQAIADKLKREAKECQQNVEGGQCSSGGPDASKAGKDAKKGCRDMEKAAEKAGNARKKEAGEMDKNGNKSGDNEKKGESAGGGMPQMPQIPQQQGGEEQQPQQQADYPQATSPTPGSESKPPEIETAKFDEDKDKTAIPAVGFGNTTPTSTATVTAPGNSFNAQGIDPNLRGLAANNFGDKPEGGAVAATASPPGGSGSGGLNSSGASLPGGGQQGGDTAKGPNEANPYEIPVGSGGRLGAPKGKTGGESDTALDAAASTAFKDDFKGGDLAGNGTGTDVAAGGEEDPGYTIFKMVKYRYAELKKKGNI